MAELFNFTTDFNNTINFGTANNTVRNPSLYFNFTDNGFVLQRGVVYDAYNQQTTLPYLDTQDGTSTTTGSPLLPVNVFNKENKWIHVVYTSCLITN